MQQYDVIRPDIQMLAWLFFIANGFVARLFILAVALENVARAAVGAAMMTQALSPGNCADIARASAGNRDTTPAWSHVSNG